MGDSSRRPAVPPEHYSTAYFLREAGGAHLLEEFRRTRGATVYPIFARIADLCGDLTGKTVLDVGCGRGELATLAVLKGARHVVAVDFSPDALALSSETARACLGHRARRVSLCLADAAAVPARRGSVDVAVLSDVVEHLYPWQIKEMYARLREALKPAGRLVVHTWPNRWHTEATYPLVVAFSRLLGRRRPASPRKAHDEIMHVYEQSPLSLWRDLRRAGFTIRTFRIDHECSFSWSPARLVYWLLHRTPPVKWLFADHLWAVGQVSRAPSA
jgi:cyclopropane fatty-acyl-phospholipid synthase-like methyltransferase